MSAIRGRCAYGQIREQKEDMRSPKTNSTVGESQNGLPETRDRSVRNLCCSLESDRWKLRQNFYIALEAELLLLWGTSVFTLKAFK